MCTPIFKLISFLLIYLITGGFCNSEEGCGIAKTLNDKIVNGRELLYGKYPWYVALVHANDTRFIVCGATLIDERHVLTAAHCFRPYRQSQSKGKLQFEDVYSAKLGVNNMCVPEEGVEIMTIIKVHIHEKYFTSLRYYDIALLTLKTKVTNFVPICLPDAKYATNNRTNLMGTIVGLGKESSAAWKSPCTVKEADVPIQSETVCLNMLAKNMLKNADPANDIFCAGYAEGGTDTCQGDSGGPLQVYREAKNSWIILGVTSFGFGCAQPNKYGVYTDVSHYVDWIEEKKTYDKNVNYTYPTPTPNITVLTKAPSKQKQAKQLNRSLNRRLISKMLED